MANGVPKGKWGVDQSHLVKGDCMVATDVATVLDTGKAMYP